MSGLCGRVWAPRDQQLALQGSGVEKGGGRTQNGGQQCTQGAAMPQRTLKQHQSQAYTA